MSISCVNICKGQGVVNCFVCTTYIKGENLYGKQEKNNSVIRIFCQFVGLQRICHFAFVSDAVLLLFCGIFGI